MTGDAILRLSPGHFSRVPAEFPYKWPQVQLTDLQPYCEKMRSGPGPYRYRKSSDPSRHQQVGWRVAILVDPGSRSLWCEPLSPSATAQLGQAGLPWSLLRWLRQKAVRVASLPCGPDANTMPSLISLPRSQGPIAIYKIMHLAEPACSTLSRCREVGLWREPLIRSPSRRALRG